MSRRAWVKQACGVLMFGCSSLAAAADSDWYYTIDQPRKEQQANFCHSKNSIDEIAGIFDRFGPRPGYAALSTSPDCGIAVDSFTPRRILTTVTISKGEPGEYMVRFVEVENDHGDVTYLVTTRNVLTE